MAKQQVYKKIMANSQFAKAGFRVVKESPAPTKIDKNIIQEAVEKAIAATAK